MSTEISSEQRAAEYREVERILIERSPERTPGIWTMEQRARILGWSFPDHERSNMSERIVEPESSNIQSLRYRDADASLVVTFKNGGIYEYQDVPAEVFEGICKAESAGKFLNSNIKGQFTAKKIEPKENAAEA